MCTYINAPCLVNEQFLYISFDRGSDALPSVGAATSRPAMTSLWRAAPPSWPTATTVLRAATARNKNCVSARKEALTTHAQLGVASPLSWDSCHALRTLGRHPWTQTTTPIPLRPRVLDALQQQNPKSGEKCSLPGCARCTYTCLQKYLNTSSAVEKWPYVVYFFCLIAH